MSLLYKDSEGNYSNIAGSSVAGVVDSAISGNMSPITSNAVANLSKLKVVECSTEAQVRALIASKYFGPICITAAIQPTDSSTIIPSGSIGYLESREGLNSYAVLHHHSINSIRWDIYSNGTNTVNKYATVDDLSYYRKYFYEATNVNGILYKSANYAGFSFDDRLTIEIIAVGSDINDYWHGLIDYTFASSGNLTIHKTTKISGTGDLTAYNSYGTVVFSFTTIGIKASFVGLPH